jgi:tRNA nucleotidyltransferase (CCA-adding enzyme)
MDLIEKRTNCKASESACNSLQMNSPGSGDELLNHSAHITLTPRETRLRDLLLDVARYIDESKVVKERLELRFAGGWVRDKLLNIPSNDIDTVINAMTGYAFSLKMKEYLERPENLKKHGLGERDVGNLHKIAANPEKSKHLETVTTKMLGFDVDFVNLRKETYSADSRNPQMEFGTAKEDALRRDATINALFYNIHTDKVEDSVGGVHDLQAKLIRTPVEPYQTFIDDPLRVLRLIRFASRLDFKIDKETEASMADQAIMDAIKLKISRERVGVEVEKMLKGMCSIPRLASPTKALIGKDPKRSLELFDRLGLYSTIFTNPMTNNQPQPSTDRWKFSYNCLEVMRLNQSPRSLYKLLVCSDEATELAWILSALSPWANVPMLPLSEQTTKALLPQATLVAREGIKLNNRMCETVTGAFKHVKEISRLKKAVNDQEPWTREPDVLGIAIQRWDAAGGHWKLHVLLAVLVEAMQSVECDGEI